ncbi:hypothetical protein AX14_014468 [Amanita brunnescens Koide BX004]|nr:hypothetical protein AX14_014468 [Amanita brunnescens Koide BX004]
MKDRTDRPFKNTTARERKDRRGRGRLREASLGHRQAFYTITSVLVNTSYRRPLPLVRTQASAYRQLSIISTSTRILPLQTKRTSKIYSDFHESRLFQQSLSCVGR